MNERDDPRTKALAAAAAVAWEPDPKVEFQSRGRVLIFGDGPHAAQAADALAASLSCLVLCDERVEVPEGVAVVRLRGRVPRIEGHLGAFTAVLEDPGEAEEADRPRYRLDLGAEVDPDRPFFDLVLDLGSAPAIDREWGPPGYFRPRGAADLAGVLAELPERIGRLEKPKFFAFDPSICAHGKPGTEGCRRCLDACPAGAIVSVEQRIQVNPNLCQGGGTCATTCPTGALTYRFPPRAATLEQLRRMLATWREAGGEGEPVVVFLEPRDDFDPAGSGPLARWPARVLPFALQEIGAVGMETWLAALAFGAVAVRVLRPPGIAPSVERVLDEQLGFTRALLAGLELPPDAVGWLAVEDDPLGAAELAFAPAAPPSGGIEAVSKRGVLFAGLDHLRARASVAPELVAVPAGAPFGRVQVNHETCTACLACAFTCPTRALSPGRGIVPQLLFVEAACVQCGLCEAACPEDAIHREARLLLPEDQRLATRVLHEDEPFACTSCGKIFASAGTIRAVKEKLADHPMFAKSGLDVLELCDDCRMSMHLWG